MLAEAERRGIYVMLCLDYHGMFEVKPDYWGGNNFWPRHPYNAANGGPCADTERLLHERGGEEAVREAAALHRGALVGVPQRAGVGVLQRDRQRICLPEARRRGGLARATWAADCERSIPIST